MADQIERRTNENVARIAAELAARGLMAEAIVFVTVPFLRGAILEKLEKMTKETTPPGPHS